MCPQPDSNLQIPKRCDFMPLEDGLPKTWIPGTWKTWIAICRWPTVASEALNPKPHHSLRRHATNQGCCHRPAPVLSNKPPCCKLHLAAKCCAGCSPVHTHLLPLDSLLGSAIFIQQDQKKKSKDDAVRRNSQRTQRHYPKLPFAKKAKAAVYEMGQARQNSLPLQMLAGVGLGKRLHLVSGLCVSQPGIEYRPHQSDMALSHGPLALLYLCVVLLPSTPCFCLQ